MTHRSPSAAPHDPKAKVYPNHPYLDTTAGGSVSGYTRELEVDSDSGLAFVALRSNDWDQHRALVDSTARVSNLVAAPTRADRGSASSSLRLVYEPAGAFFISQDNLRALSGSAHGSEVISGVSYPYVEIDTDGTAATSELDLYAAIPAAFSGWDTNGIRLLCRWQAYGGSGTATVQIEAMDPATGASFGTPKTASRGATAAEATYSYLTINSTTLSTDYSAGDLLKLRLSLTASTAVVHSLYVSWLELLWN